MSDIFVSYGTDDRERVRPLVRALEGEGWSVWWDRHIRAGRNFDEVIEQAIREARCVLVVWTEQSVLSRWVKTEASEGVERGVLIPVLLDEVRPPFEFRRLRAARLVGWAGEADDEGYVALLNSLTDLLGEPDKPAPTPPAGTETPPTGRPIRPAAQTLAEPYGLPPPPGPHTTEPAPRATPTAAPTAAATPDQRATPDAQPNPTPPGRAPDSGITLGVTVNPRVIDLCLNEKPVTRVRAVVRSPHVGLTVDSYKYKVSAGTVRGEGPTVTWDLGAVPMGDALERNFKVIKYCR